MSSIERVTRFLNPQGIRFSQHSMKAIFSDGSSVEELVSALQSGRISPQNIPAIRVVEREGILFTLDNRRLEAFRRARVVIPTRMATSEEIMREAWKFTTQNAGVSIKIRGE